MNWDSFLNFIKKSAQNEVKFFGSNCQSDDFGAIVTAFANTKGGYVVIGFDRNNYHLTGTEISVDWIDNLIKSFCSPKVEYECFEIEKNDKKIIVINISQNYDKPYYFNDKCYVLNTQNSKITIMEKEIIDGTPRVLKQNTQTSPNLNKEEFIKKTEQKPTVKTPVISDQKVKSEAEELEDLTKELEDLTNDFDQSETNLPFFTNENNETNTVEEENQTEKDSPELFKKSSNTLNERQEKTLVYLTKNNFIKNKKYRELYNVSHKTAHLELIDLVQKKLIKSQGSGRSTCYVINMPVQQQII